MEEIGRKASHINLGSGIGKKKFKISNLWRMQKIEPLSNFDINNFVKKLKIKNFRGVFMKDELPQRPKNIECGIINLENQNQEGSHWTAYYKNKDLKYYFDSYGNIVPPIELVKYLGKNNLYYNEKRIQNFNDPPICGHLCLLVLKDINKYDFRNIIEKLVKSGKQEIEIFLNI